MPDIKRIKARLEGLRKERRKYEGKWRDIGDFIYPEATAFIEDYEKEIDAEDDAILNSVPVQAHRVLASGMQAGLTSPSRPWFRLDLPDQRLTEYPAVKDWLKRTEDMMYIIFAKSNFYDATSNLYYQLSGPGNGAFAVFDDFETAIRCHCYSVGEYWLANDPKGRVNRFARCWKM
ncbi:MAG: portal protein, partial [Cloacibacillus sp.]